MAIPHNEDVATSFGADGPGVRRSASEIEAHAGGHGDRYSRRARFEQREACVYEPEGEPEVIVTEWPNGTIDRLEAGSDLETRTWPDGSTETRPAVPALAARRGRRETMPKLIIVIGANGAGKVHVV